MKNLVYFLLLSLILLNVSGCRSKKNVQKPLPVDKSVVILAVNDMHAAIDKFPRFAYMVDSLRRIHPDLLLLSAGDNQSGNPVNDQYKPKGVPIIELMNALKFDLSAVGNHEFDTKKEGFMYLAGLANFDFVNGNIKVLQETDRLFKPYKIIETANRVKVAVASVLFINSDRIPDTHPDNVKDFSFDDPIERAKDYLFLKDSCDVFIFLNHLGFEDDVVLAQQTPAGTVDLIIGGHSHTKVDTEQIHNGILITQAVRDLKFATLIKLTKHSDGTTDRSMQLLPIDPSQKEVSDFRKMVDAFNEQPALQEHIAEAEDDFTSYDHVGYLMADALQWGTKTDIALVNRGGVRIENLPKGPVKVKDVYTMDPFGNEAVLFTLSGNELRALMRYAYKRDEYLPIYPAGIRSRYILNKEGEVEDIQLFTTDGKDLDLDRYYTVAMNSYMASIYDYEHTDPGKSLFRPTAENTIEYLRQLKRIPSYRDVKRVEIIK